MGDTIGTMSACRAGDQSSIPGPGENFSLKLYIYNLQDSCNLGFILEFDGSERKL